MAMVEGPSGFVQHTAELILAPISLVVFSLYRNTNHVTYNNDNNDYQLAFLQ